MYHHVQGEHRPQPQVQDEPAAHHPHRRAHIHTALVGIAVGQEMNMGAYTNTLPTGRGWTILRRDTLMIATSDLG